MLPALWANAASLTTHWRLVAQFAVGSLAVAFGAAAVGSCSRGGWLALCFGALLILIVCRRLPLMRQAMLVIFLSVSIAVALAPKAQARAATLAAIGHDVSLHSRLETWAGTSALVADHPWTGCGAGRFGHVYEVWYQQRYKGVFLFQPFNDGLLIAAEHGLPVAWLFWAITAGLVIMLTRLAFRCSDPMAGAFSGAISAGSVSGLFHCLQVDAAWWYHVGLAAACAIYVLGSARRRTIAWAGGRIAIEACLFALAAALGVLAVGSMAARALPYRPGPGGEALATMPRIGSAQATILVVRDESGTDRELSEHILRRLAGAGYAVSASTTLPTAEPDGSGHPVVVIATRGSGTRPMRAWTSTWTPAAIVLLDAHPAVGADEQLPRCPIFVIDGSFSDDETPAVAMRRLLAWPGSKHLRAPVAVLWPRHYAMVHAEVTTWLTAVLPPNRPPAADPGSQLSR